MYLKSIELSNFRNFPSGQFEFCPGLNILIGPNASGKTNLLEAIYLLSNLRSFRTHSLRELITWKEEGGYLRGVVQPGNYEKHRSTTSKKLVVKILPHTKLALINAKPCKTAKDYLRILPSTAFVPDDLNLVKGTPAFRRYFLDRGTFLFYPPYWAFLTEYNKILRQKNALLRKLQHTGGKEPKLGADEIRSADPCMVWNAQLQATGSKIIIQRLLFVQNLQRLLHTVYTRWLEAKEMLDLRYKLSIGSLPEHFQRIPPTLNHENQQYAHQIWELYGNAIQSHLERERRLGTTVIGPHRDDLEIDLQGKSLRSYGSQGQQRTAVLAMKLAEIQLYFEQYDEYPILLLDDVSSELDIQRNTSLLDYLQQGMQVFISTTSTLALSSLHSLPCIYFDLSQNLNTL